MEWGSGARGTRAPLRTWAGHDPTACFKDPANLPHFPSALTLEPGKLASQLLTVPASIKQETGLQGLHL